MLPLIKKSVIYVREKNNYCMKSYKIQGFIYDDMINETINQIKQETNDTDAIEIVINSGGGSVFAGLTMYNFLNNRKGKVNVIIDTLCASIASVIAMAGDSVLAYKNSLIMIHKPYSVMYGNGDEFKNEGDLLKEIENIINDVYNSKVSENFKNKQDWMDSFLDNWINTSEAKEQGLIDGIIDKKNKAFNLVESLVASVTNVKFNKNKDMSEFNDNIEGIKKENKELRDEIGKLSNELKKASETIENLVEKQDGFEKSVNKFKDSQKSINDVINGYKSADKVEKDWDWYMDNGKSGELEEMQESDPDKFNELYNKKFRK